MHALLKGLGSKRTTKVDESYRDNEAVTEQPQEHDTSGSDDSPERNPWSIVRLTEFRQPSRFKELHSLLDKFTGKSVEGDFEAWLEDCVEATRDYGWNNEQRSHWFSWFITGPAKLTWQHTLSA